MEFLLQNFPQESILFFRRVLFLALTTGLAVVIPLAVQVWKCWDSVDGWDNQVKWWIFLRLTAFCSQLPIRGRILKDLSFAEQAPSILIMRERLMQMTQSTFWHLSQHVSIFLCSWLLLSFVFCICALPETELTIVLYWVCWWTVLLIAFHLAVAIYMLHKMLHENDDMDHSDEREILLNVNDWSRLFEKQGDDEYAQCDICFQDYEICDNIRQFTRCRHHYHKDCIDPWMENHIRCPFCQQRIDEPPTQKSAVMEKEDKEEVEEEENDEELEENDKELEEGKEINHTSLSNQTKIDKDYHLTQNFPVGHLKLD